MWVLLTVLLLIDCSKCTRMLCLLYSSIVFLKKPCNLNTVYCQMLMWKLSAFNYALLQSMVQTSALSFDNNNLYS